MPDWSIAVCVASGPSLTRHDCELVNRTGLPIIAVNDSIQMCPGASAVFAGDYRWWMRQIGPDQISGLALLQQRSYRQFAGAEAWTTCHHSAKRFSLRHFVSAVPGSFNSGQRAIELAIRKGARRILLIGYDCSLENGTHWHGRHEGMANPDRESIETWKREFFRLSQIFPDVEIINASRHTDLTCFPRQNLEEWIARLSSPAAQAPRDLPPLTISRS